MSKSIAVHGMSCEHCENTVEEAIESVSGVTGVRVDHETDSATIDGTAETHALIAAIEDAGYDAEVAD